MEVNVEESNILSSVTQKDLVTSPILYQCLYVIRTVSEFQNLTYRVTKTLNDMEVLIVYREGILGIFGPPLDPIMLTIDPKGRCQLNILFKPVQRVCIISPESGNIEIESLLAVLRLIAGKGYLFCPGLPERFLVGKACGKFVVLHRIPFKRYQSSQCPVYYKIPVFKQNNNKPSLCTLCPRCLQAAKLIHALPTFASGAAGIAAQMPTQISAPGQLKLDQRNVVQSVSTKNVVTSHTNNTVDGNSVFPVSASRFLSLANFHNNTATSVVSDSQINSNNQQITDVNVTGNHQGTVAVEGINNAYDQSSVDRDTKEASVDSKVKILKVLLKNLLQSEYRNKSMESSDPSKTFADIKVDPNEAPQFLLEDKYQKRNTCRHCKKHYSTPANLQNHLQRHEVLSGTWQKKFRDSKLCRKPSLFSPFHRLFNRSKFLLARNNRNQARLSGTLIKLFLKCLDDMIPSQNGAKCLDDMILSKNGSKCLELPEYDIVKPKIVENGTLEKQESSEVSQVVSCEQIKNATHLIKCGLKRTSSGLSPMQTLLEAAAIAEVGEVDKNDPIIQSSSPFAPMKYQEAAVVPTTSQSTISVQYSEVSFPEKRPRKSTRLATKRARYNKKRTRDDDCCADMEEAENTSHEHTMLTNLNLLSTVSLETAMRQAAVSSPIPQTVLSPVSKAHTLVLPYATSILSTLNDSPPAYPTSKSVSISQQLLNNTSGGNVVISKSQDTCGSFNSANAHNSRLPPVPPLLFAGDVQMKGLYPVLSQGQTQSGTQTVLESSPSTLRSLVIVGNNQPYPSVSIVSAPETDVDKNNSPNSDCGAIDLSKPKISQTKLSIPPNLEKGIDFSFLSGLPHNIAQLVAGNENPSEVLQCFMMGNSDGISVPEHKEAALTSAVMGDKKSDSELQARMFASASNYRIDKGIKKVQQVHSVIASSSRTAKPGKEMKPDGVAAVHTDEIQCAYKWSGSGGSVKERTQLVRELVPPDVMASYLIKPQMSTPSSQQLNINHFNTSQPQQQSPQLVQPSMSGWSTQNKSQDPSTAEVALNLITSKSTEATISKKGAAGRTQISTPNVVILSSPPPTQNWSPPSPISPKSSILRTSLTSTSGIINQLKGHLANVAGGSATDSSQKLQLKTFSLAQITSPPPSSLSTTPAPPSGYTISSPSLAAMLRQPAATMYETNHKNINSNISSPASLTHHNSIIDSYSVLPTTKGVQIKTEPIDSFNTDQTNVISLQIKTEKQDAEIVESDASRDADSSPTNLVVDMGPDTADSRNTAKKLKSVTAPVSKAPNLTNKRNPVKYNHRNVIL